MQSDILPPNFKRSNTNTPKNSPMRSLRLQGHSFDDARKRLVAAEKNMPGTNPQPAGAEAQELVSFNESLRKKGLRAKLSRHLRTRTKLELLVLAAILLLGGSGLAYTLVHYAKKPAQHVALKQTPVKAVPPPPPTTVPSPLSGVQVPPQFAQRPVTGIMIENSPDARPQSGLQDAGVVYEAIAEGGITRFLAVFQDTRPGYIGPVRSLRPYYLDFATPYQASIAHVGGSPEALATVRNGHYRDIDQFFNNKYYTRINSRAAPHNVYTNFDWLDQLNQAKGYAKSEYSPWKRKADTPAATPTAVHLDVKISSPLYYSHYDYDKATNTYLRSEGGKPHLQILAPDSKSAVQLQPKSILTLVMNYKVIDRAGHSSYVDTGSGAMKLFQDGTEVDGTWNKADQASMFVFKDSTGKEIALNAGQTWIVIVGSPANVSFSP
jgi:hypothetical protein